MSDKLTLNNLAGLEIYKPQSITFLKTLIYGDSDSGKTTLAGSISKIAECSPTLMIDIEGGATSVRHFKNLEVIHPINFKQIWEIWRQLAPLSAKGNLPYKTIILDSSTELQRLGTERVMERTVARAAEKGDDKDPDHPDWGDWTKSHNQFRRVMRGFRDLNANVIITCLAQTDMSRPSVPKAKPQLNGIMKDEISASFDVVLFLTKAVVKDDTGEESIERRALTESTEHIVAKDRTGNLDRLEINPDFETLYPKLMELN